MEIVKLLAFVLRLMAIAIVARAILSFIVPMLGERPHPALIKINVLLGQITEPVLGPLRRMLPTFGMLDLSPMVAILALEFIRAVLINRTGG